MAVLANPALANTSTTLVSRLNPSTYGQPVAFAAKVSAVGTSQPTGQVTLYEGAVALASSTLDPSGQANFQIRDLSAGRHTLTASYEGDSASAPSKSPAVVQEVGQSDQTIRFAPLPRKTYGDADFALDASATSHLAVSFQIVSGPATMAGNLVHLTGAGKVTVRASQSGDGNYRAAPDVDQAFDVEMAGQTIAFGPLRDRTFGDAPFAIAAQGGGSGRPVRFTAAGACAVSGNTVTITAAGHCTITASQAGDSNFHDATPVPRLFTINRAVQALVTVSAPPDATFGQTGLTATASGGTGTGSFRFSAGTSSACAVDPATGAISITFGAGDCSIAAWREADAHYIDAAPSTPAVISIHKAAAKASVVSSKNPAVSGEAVTFTAEVTGPGGTPAGIVTFLDGTETIGSAAVGPMSPVVHITLTLSPGSHSITVVYSGDNRFTGSTSPALVQKVG